MAPVSGQWKGKVYVAPLGRGIIALDKDGHMFSTLASVLPIPNDGGDYDLTVRWRKRDKRLGKS